MEGKDIKLIVTDLDGTLLGNHGRIPQLNIDAIRAAKELGVRVCACTARNWPETEKILEQAGLVDYVMLNNGAVILDATNKEIQYRNRIDPALVGPVLEAVQEISTWYGVSGTFHSYSWPGARREFVHPHRNSRTPEEERDRQEWMKRMRETRIEKETFDEFVAVAKEDCNYISAGLTYEQHIPLYAAISEVGAFELSSADDDHVYIMAKDVTKGLAVEILAELYGFTRDQVLAFGDNKNDASMLSWAGIGVAMGNGNQQAKSAADYVTVKNTEGGVGREIFRLVVNPRR